MGTLAKRPAGPIRPMPAIPGTAIARPDEEPARVYLASLAPTGRRTTLARLKGVAGMFGAEDPAAVPWQQIRFQHVDAVRARLLDQGAAPATVNAALAALRGVARAAFNLGLMSGDEYLRIRNVRPARGERLPPGRAIAWREFHKLVERCEKDRDAQGDRDAAILALLFGGGLRRAEVVALDVGSYTEQTGTVRFIGKGNREREQVLPAFAIGYLHRWMGSRGMDPGAMFLPIHRTGGVLHQRAGQPARLSAQAVYAIVNRRAAQAKVRNVKPHDLRRTYATRAIEETRDLSAVQKGMGHRSPETTARYDMRQEEAKRLVAEALNAAYEREKGGASRS